MIALLISSFFLIFISLITGHVICRKLNLSDSWIEKCLVGIALSNTIFSILSIFFPIRPYFLFIYFFVCCGFLLFEYKTIFRSLIPRHGSWFLYLAIVVIILIGFINSLYYPIVFDSGLYHVQSIEWIENYPAVPGLANLHGRFGFNPNVFTLFAATSFDGIFKNEIYSVNFVIYCLLSIYFITRIYKFYQKTFFFVSIMYIGFLIILLDLLDTISSPTPDFISYCIPFFIFLRFFELLYFERDLNVRSFYPIIILSLYVVTVKIASLPVLLIIPLIFYQNFKKIALRDVYIIIIFALFIIIPWIARNVILTGWIIFPFAGIDLFSFDWEVPKSNVVSLIKTITAWGRNPAVNDFLKAADMSFGEWFLIWWSRQSFMLKLIFIFTCLTPVISILLALIFKVKMSWKSFHPVFIIAFSGFAFWFLISPDWRYGLGWVVLCIAFPFTLIKNPKINNKHVLNLILSTILIYAIYINTTTKIIYIRKTSVEYFMDNLETIIYVTPRMDQKTRKWEQEKFKSFIMDNKIEVRYPESDFRCFDEDIPCMSFPNDKVHLRRDDLRSGFYQSK